MWHGALGAIPANWNLCDGTGVTPNLVARFIRGAPVGVDPGATGGADSHTHLTMTAAGGHLHTVDNQAGHTHVVNSAGSHTHGSLLKKTNVTSTMKLTAGAHQHTTNACVAHGHTWSNPGNHTHVINAADGRPPYYEVAFIQAAAGAAVAAGIIIIWTGTLAAIPAGWSLCDGGGGRPDLRDRFVRGINTAITPPGGLGGNLTHTHIENNTPHGHGTTNAGAHTHTFPSYDWIHTHNDNTSDGANPLHQSDSGAGVHIHAVTNDPGNHNHNPIGNITHNHTVNTASSLPAYYKVAYIINVAAADIPQNGILIWTGTLATIPAQYELCNGSGGKPELRSRFIYGTAAGIDPGGIGGSDTHTHTDQANGAHNTHTQTTAGAHQHNATNSIGAHTHALDAGGTTAVAIAMEANNSAGAHSHTFNLEGGHTHANQSDPGNHVHNPWSTDDGRPAYYEVAFVIRVTVAQYIDIPTRFRLHAQDFIDTATRFRLVVRDYIDIPTRFRLVILNFVDVATRFRLTIPHYIDIPTRFRLVILDFIDVATRFRLIVLGFVDVATRFRLVVLNHVDVATRFRLIVLGFVDVATRFRLVILSHVDVQTRFHLRFAVGFADAATRFHVAVVICEEPEHVRL